jgi:Domain of unknown function (DUF4416)
MGTAREPAPVKYFAALLSSDQGFLSQVENDLATVAGAVETRSAVFPWSFSKFYETEMGAELSRKFVSFAPLGSPENLAAIKCATQRIEALYRNAQGGRRVNIDPGYLDLYKIVLASTKNAGQRIFLRQGIYGEVTLLFHDARFHGLGYTYRDYLASETLEFFSSLRVGYLAQLKQPR